MSFGIGISSRIMRKHTGQVAAANVATTSSALPTSSRTQKYVQVLSAAVHYRSPPWTLRCLERVLTSQKATLFVDVGAGHGATMQAMQQHMPSISILGVESASLLKIHLVSRYPWALGARKDREVGGCMATHLRGNAGLQDKPYHQPPPMRLEQSAAAPLLTNTTPARRQSCSKKGSHKVNDAFEVILFSPHWECTDTQGQCLDRSGMRIHIYRHRNKPKPSRRAGPGSAAGAQAAPPPPRGNEKHSQAICIHPQRGRREHDEARWRKMEGKASTRIREREVNHPTHKPCTPTRNQVIMTRNSRSGPLHSRFIPYFDSAATTMDNVLQTESLFVSTESDTETVEICIVIKGTNGALAEETKAQVQYALGAQVKVDVWETVNPDFDSDTTAIVSMERSQYQELLQHTKKTKATSHAATMCPGIRTMSLDEWYKEQGTVEHVSAKASP